MTPTVDDYVDKNNRLIAAPDPRWMHSPKRIRVYLGGEAIAESTNAHLLRESGPPVYYFPESDVRMDLFTPSSFTKDSPTRGNTKYWSIEVGERTAENSAWTYNDLVEGAEFLRGYIAFDWGKMDAWFEEKEEVFVHAKDPFKRIDTLKTDRKVSIIIDNEIVAESSESVLLLEPGHPVRYYLPMADVRREVLRASNTVSRCPYKGAANYYTIEINGKRFEDVAWSYRYATPEASKVTAMICFFNERVDDIIVDGAPLPKPETGWRR